jgi:RNA polymerase sigma-70 factor (ECF subfamily)
VVQDVHERWLAIDASTVASPKAWLERAVTNRCLDVLASARTQRETYVGPWLPEPVVTEHGLLAGEPVDPRTISLAFLALLERLSPLERAAWVLAEVFDYTAAELATVLGKEPAAVRQALHRAREHVREGRPRFPPDAQAHGQLLAAFASAVGTGDVSAVEQLLAKTVVARSDGGGKVLAARNLIEGPDRVARLMVGLARKADPAWHLELGEVNGWPALIVLDGAHPISVMELETDGVSIFALWVVTNPEKLASFAAQVTARAAGSSSLA